MVVEHVRVRHVDLVRHQDLVVGREHADLDAIGDAQVDQFLSIHRQRFVRRVRDLAGDAEAAGRIAMRAGIALHEDAMKDRLFRIVDPVLLRQVGPGDTDVDAANRDMPQSARRRPHVFRRLVADQLDQFR